MTFKRFIIVTIISSNVLPNELTYNINFCFSCLDQPNRPTLSLSNIKPLNYVEDIDVSLPLDQQW